jgi:hypothetical protein
MNKRHLTVLSFFCLAIILFSSCKKEGPAGPAGPAGPTGATGPTGPTGPQGPAGTANVIYSRWTNGSAWTPEASTGLVFYNIPATSLTQSLLSTGSLHVYWAVLGDTVNNVRQLPFTEIVGAEIYFHNSKFTVGNIRVETNNLSISTTNRYRYILIPGGVLGGRLSNNINFDNYNEVLDRLKIPF